MSTITTIAAGDTITSSRTVINTNFSNLNTDKIETSYLDTDTALTANSDSKIATQKATKAYVDSITGLIGTSGVSSGPASTTTQTVTHSLGRTPRIIRITGFGEFITGSSPSMSQGTYNSTGNRCVYATGVVGGVVPATSTTFAVYVNNETTAKTRSASGVVQNVGATTFDIAWTVTGGDTGGATKFIWEAS